MTVLTLCTNIYIIYRYFEFEILTAGPMKVGWARADCSPGFQLGSDEYSWAYDGFNVSKLTTNYLFIFNSFSFLRKSGFNNII